MNLIPQRETDVTWQRERGTCFFVLVVLLLFELWDEAELGAPTAL